MPGKLRVFVDADVLIAGAASPSDYGASLVVLRMAEITLIDAIASQQVITEAERNLAAFLPTQISTLQMLIGRCLRIVPDPTPDELTVLHGLADPKDLPILAAAVREQCPWLVTFNLRHFQPGHPLVRAVQPGQLVQEVRASLAYLSGTP